MKKVIRLSVLAAMVIAIVSVFSVSALETPEAAQVESEKAMRIVYDVGHYGRNSPELFEWNTEITYPVARYKRNTQDRSAAHRYGSAVSHNGGWAKWYVVCVSDGEQATYKEVIADFEPARTEVDYVDSSYGTTGYTDRLHIEGCYGSMSAGVAVSNASWCPYASGVN